MNKNTTNYLPDLTGLRAVFFFYFHNRELYI